ncbi:MAG: insulinase family protein [Candidatus Riflebacteria bacterium]|nr:insulinase family protein [Candidatus Riflebacteria bacterium]
MMRTGGTEKMIGDQIDEELEYMAASVETYVGEEAGVATLSVLKKDLDRGLSIFSEVLMRPAFAHDKVELKKNQVIEGIRRRNDKAAWIVQREWKRLVFQGHPFGRISTVKTVTAIAREDLIRFHQQFYYPNNISLVVSGDFVEADLLKKLEGVFGAWPSRPAPALPAPQVPLAFRASVNHIEKDVPQASIRLGHLGVTKLDPDWHALEVFDNVLGSNGFSSRLMREVRSNRGLAYSVGSGVTGGRSRGVILAACQTKSKSCVEALDLIMQILRQIRTQPVSVEELKIARESLLNSFVFQFTSSYGIATAHADLEYLGLPTDWYDTYKDRIARVTADDVLRVARQHLHPDKLTILVVGKQAEFDRPLATLGKVTQLPLDDYTGR